MIEIAGGENLISSKKMPSRKMQLEEIKEANPDVVVIMPCGFDVYKQLSTWMAADVSAHPKFGGDLDAALGAIRARALVMPCDTDVYFRVRDNEIEVAKMPNAELRVIRSAWGHAAGGPTTNPDDAAFVDGALKELLTDKALGARPSTSLC